MVLHDTKHQSSLPTQSAWAGVYLLALACASYPVDMPFPAMAMYGGLVGLLAGLGLEQSQKRVRAALQYASSIRQHIWLQTRGRIHDLSVQLDGDRACIEGYAASYYLVQLAHSAVLDMLGSSHRTVEFKIRVRKGNSPDAF